MAQKLQSVIKKIKISKKHTTTSTNMNDYILCLQNHGLDTRKPARNKTKAGHPKTKTNTSKKVLNGHKNKTGSGG